MTSDDDELRFHLEMRTRDYERAGYTRAEAERLARARLGDLGQVRRELGAQEAKRVRMDRVAWDARVALRGLRRSPTFTVTAILILGVGIGMAVAMWAVLNAVLLRPTPIAEPDRVVLPRILDDGGTELGFGTEDLVEMRHASRTLRAITGFEQRGAISWPMVDAERPLPLAASLVDNQFFDVLGVRPLKGRLLGPSDDSLSRVMVLSYDAWQRYFGGDSAVIGRQFHQTALNATYTVVGVAPPGIDLPAGTDYWVPLPGLENLHFVARLAPHMTLAMARREVQMLSEQLVREQHWPGSLSAIQVPTFETAVVGTVRPALVSLTAAVGLLLLIVCINIGTLQLMRAASRSREFAVRRALGASWVDIVRQLVTESVLLGVAGGMLGLVVGELARRALVAAAPPQLPRLDALRASGAPIGMALGLTLVSVFLFGLAPVLVSGRRDPGSHLKLDARSGSSTRRRHLARNTLVGSQLALAVMLLAGAGLLARSLHRLQSLELGFRADHLSVLVVEAPVPMHPDRAHFFALWDALAPRLHAVPGVTAISPIGSSPLTGSNGFLAPFQADRQSPEDVAHDPLISIEASGPEYFRALGMPITRGREFLESDRETSPDVVIVSASVARRYWPGQDPIGRRIRAAGFTGEGGAWRTVVGVVGETRWRSLRTPMPIIYLPYRQNGWFGYVALRSTTSLAAMLPAIRRAIRDADPDAVVMSARTIDDYLAAPLAEPRMSALTIATFGLVALVLAAIGLYGVMASAVREQTRDIGVRMALGATPRRVRGEVLGRALAVSTIGAAVGIVAALAASRILGSLLFEVSPSDPVSFAGACAVLLSVAAVAAYLPARRASRIDAAGALRAD